MQGKQQKQIGAPSQLQSLVDWQHKAQKVTFPLLTIHSLTLDDNPKYIYLKQLISNYNQDPQPSRMRYQQIFIQKLFKLMSQMSRMEGIENQLECLEKVYIWAVNGKDEFQEKDKNINRPQTASTRTKFTRPTTAYSKPPTQIKHTLTNNRPGTAVIKNNGRQAGSRPQTGTIRNKITPTQTISQQGLFPSHELQTEESALKFLERGPPPQGFPKEHPQKIKNIDYSKLNYGECEFYTGGRTLHPEYEHPAKRLKDYQRKLFQEDDDVEVIDLQELDQKEEEAARQKLKELEINEEKILREIEEAKALDEANVQGGQGVQGVQGVQGGENGGEEENNENLEGDVNVDDIPLEGEEEQLGVIEPEEEPQVVDKLRPRLKAYGEKKGQSMKHFQKKHYEGGCLERRLANHDKERKDQEDRVMAKMEAEWAQAKGRAKSEMKRRAQSARIVRKITVGVRDPKYVPSKDEQIGQNVVNLLNVTPAEVPLKYNKESRPATATFLSDRSKQRQNVIKNSLLNGNIQAKQLLQKLEGVQPNKEVSLVVKGQNPKKKTFEQILRQADERVIRESQTEIMEVKQAFSKNKISFGMNRIAKSITHDEREIGEWEGPISGITLIKNPFIKVAKKKKKKKKKN